MSVTTSLADAIVAAINQAELSQSVTAVRSHLPIFDLEKIGDAIHVSVVPSSVEITTASRSTNFFDIAIDVGVQSRVDPNDAAQIDALLDLVEQIGDALRLKKLDTFANAQWISTEHDPVIAAEHLERLNVFTSVLTVTYRITR